MDDVADPPPSTVDYARPDVGASPWRPLDGPVNLLSAVQLVLAGIVIACTAAHIATGESVGAAGLGDIGTCVLVYMAPSAAAFAGSRWPTPVGRRRLYLAYLVSVPVLIGLTTVALLWTGAGGRGPDVYVGPFLCLGMVNPAWPVVGDRCRKGWRAP